MRSSHTLALTLALLVGGITAIAAAELPPLREVPHPDLGGVEPTVRNQLAEARARLDGLVAKSGVDPRELGQSFAEMGQSYLVTTSPTRRRRHSRTPVDCCRRTGAGRICSAPSTSTIAALDEAARWYEVARAADPKYLPTLLRLGDVRALQGDLGGAKTLYEDALKLDPDAAYTHAALGKLAAREKRFADAARELERALELDPKATSLHYPTAQAYRALGDEASMQRHLDKNGEGRVRFADPVAEEVQRQVRGAGAELLLARMAMRDGAMDVAESRVRRAIELDAANPSAWNNLGVILDAQGKTSEAADAYAEAARLDPESIGRRFTLARLYQRLGRDEEAAAELRSVLERAPDFVEGRSELATVLARQGRLDEAVLEAREALAADPRATAARWSLIEILEQQGKPEEARRELETLVSLAPEFTSAQFKLGSLLAEEGDSCRRDRALRARGRARPRSGRGAPEPGDPLRPSRRLRGGGSAPGTGRRSRPRERRSAADARHRAHPERRHGKRAARLGNGAREAPVRPAHRRHAGAGARQPPPRTPCATARWRPISRRS